MPMLRLYVLAFLFFAANSALTVILPLRSEAEGMNQTEIGLMMGGYMFTCMLLRPFAAQLLSRYGPLRVMQGLLLLHAVTLCLFLAANPAGYLWLRALQGVATAFFSMTMQAGIVEKLADKQRGQGLSMYTLFTMLPSLAVPALALHIWDSSLPYAILLLALAVLPLLAGYTARLPKAVEAGQAYSAKELLLAVRRVGHSTPLLVCSTVMLAASCVFGASATFAPLYMVSSGTHSAGLYLTIQGLVVISCRFVLRKRIPSDGSWHPRLIAALLGSAAVGMLLLALQASLGATVYLSAVFSGFAVALLYPTLTTYLSFVLPSHTRYVLMGIFMSSYDLGFSLGSLAMGPVVQFSSYPAMFTVCTLLSAGAAVLVIASRRRMGEPIADSTATS
nr:MFS transporter [Paenibacillus sp. SYP-B4298]